MKLILHPSERPMGYRALRGRAVWFKSAWTTKAEAVAKKRYEQEHGRKATIVIRYRDEKPSKYYAVYSSN